LGTDVSTVFHPTTSIAMYSYVAEVAKRYHAEVIVLAHNHITSFLRKAEPSEPDSIVTQTIESVLKQNSVSLWDHLIFTCDGCFSVTNPKVRYYDPEKKTARPAEK